MEIGTHRPRNVGWARAAGLLYGDWGTSKAYVTGAAFAYPLVVMEGHTREVLGFASLPVILAVCALTGLVGYNYSIICKDFPDGGGVYSSARVQSRVLAVLGALLLVADLTVTASLSAWSAMAYFQVPKSHIALATAGLIFVVGALNHFGPKHTGSFAFVLAAPMVVVVLSIIAMSLPHLTRAHLTTTPLRLDELPPVPLTMATYWTSFVGVILALSGVEAIANLTGVMKLDPGSTMENPSVKKTSRIAIFIVALEVVVGTALLGWAMLSLSPDVKSVLLNRWDDMLTVLAEQYGQMCFGATFSRVFGAVTAIIVGLLLLSAVNTAIGALIGLLYLLARDGEMPRTFSRLNSHGVPWLPLVIATTMPVVVVAVSPDQMSLMELYAIGVVGAITVNLGSCAFNRNLKMVWHERGLMAITFLILFAVEMTLAKTKPNALYFVVCILLVGFGLRWYAMKRAGIETVIMTREMAAAVIRPEQFENLRPKFEPGQSILVAARGFTPVLRFALEEAKLRKGNVYVLYVKQLSVTLPARVTDAPRAKWQTDRQASEIMYGVIDLAQGAGVSVVPVYAVSENPAATILDIAATLGVDMLMLGAPHRHSLAKLLQGDVVTEVARNLPENIQLIIHG